MAISLDSCPNFIGDGHRTANKLVPGQLRAAHLHPLEPLGSTVEKSPLRSIDWGEWEGGIDSHASRYGVCITRSKLFVFDVDTHHDIDGPAVFAALCAAAGHDLPATFTVATPTGGFHYYFELPEAHAGEEFSKKGSLWQGVDVFPSGQNIVGPGSTRTLEDGTVARYEVSNDLPVAELPEWLWQLVMDRITANAAAKTAEREATRQRYSDPATSVSKAVRSLKDISEGQQRVLQGKCDELRNLPAGNRNDPINQALFSMGSFFGPDAKHIVQPLLVEAALASGHDERSVHNMADRSYDAGAERYEPFVPTPRRVATTASLAAVNVQPEPVVRAPKPDPNERIDWTFYYDDSELARRFMDASPKRFAWVTPDYKWIAWDEAGNQWVDVEAEESDVTNLIQAFLDEEKREAIEGTDEERRKAARVCGSANTTRRIFSIVRPRWTVAASRFDANPRFRGMKNGVYDLLEDKLLPHSPEYYLRKQMTANYTDERNNELVELVLSALPTPEKRTAIMFFFGQALNSAKPASHSFYTFQGNTRNGKSSVLNLMERAAGSYASKIGSDAFLSNRETANAFSMADLTGLEIAIAAEPDGIYVDAGKIKRATGEDSFMVNVKHKGNRLVWATASLFFNSNGWIRCKGLDIAAVLQRIVPINFPNTYISGHPLNGIDGFHFEPDDRATLAMFDQDAIDVFGSIMVAFASQWFRTKIAKRKALEEIHIAAYADDKEKYRASTDRFMNATEDVFEAAEGYAVSVQDVRDALSAHFKRTYGENSVPGKEALADQFERSDFFKLNNVVKSKARFTAKVSGGRKRSEYVWLDYRNEQVSNSFTHGMLYTGIKFTDDFLGLMSTTGQTTFGDEG